ncbi:MAG: sulfatase-like hydrolase/transferase, partial [Planctomycetota bacterium]
MNRRDFLKLAGFTAAGTLLSPLHKTYAAAKTQKPNIIIILADDLGWADVGYHGGRIATPNIDRLAREGVRLENFHACPLCS